MFELHAGRQDHQPLENLFIDKSKSSLSNKNDHPRSTSKDLIEALGKVGEEYQTPKKYFGKNDLSYSDAATAVLDWRAARQQAAANIAAGRDEKWGLHPKDILVAYLQHVTPVLQYQARPGVDDATSQLDCALSRVFNRRNELYFKKKGWVVTDLMDWAWILTGDTAERAARRLAYIGRLGMQEDARHKIVPNFVYTFLLRRRTINAPALKTLLAYAWDYMGWLSQKRATPNEKNSAVKNSKEAESEQLHGMEEFIFMLIIIRLLRNARKVMPSACESIVALLCRYLDSSQVPRMRTNEDASSDRSAALTFMYNSALTLVAFPATLHPFRSATHQRRAQFMILRRMTQYHPPLIVDRRGYRAVTRMQLMHKKTSREREWALLKARSWPPWKEDRLGIDEDIGPEHGISQAKAVLNQAREAGYATDEWDDAASILAGWDTDDSPTIQTRSILGDKPKKADQRAKSMTWAARIKATRTLPEAWAAFLSYEDSGSEKSAVVYHAMFEKLFFKAKRTSTRSDQGKNSVWDARDEEPLPGDGPEVYPTPISPHHATYVRTPPPSIDQLTQRMIEHGVRPKAQGGFLTMLLRNAPSLAAGVRFLETSNLPAKHTAALLTRPTNTVKGSQVRQLLEEIPAKLFTAFIEFLTRFAWGRPAMVIEADGGKFNVTKNKPLDTQENLQRRLDSWKPASQAMWLVLDRQPRERGPWYSVLAALARSGVITPLVSYSKVNSYSAIANWRSSYWLLRCMEDLDIALDLAAMKILCTGLEKAIFEAEQVIYQKMGIENVRHIPRADLELVLDKGLPLVKHIFKDIVRSQRMQQDIPQSVLDNQDQSNLEVDTSPRKTGVKSSDNDETDDGDEDLDDDNEEDMQMPDNYLPPACLIPKLLEVPDTAQLHSFIRILGLRRDYQGLLDLIEWMALYSDEIRAVTKEQQNGATMTRRCMTATRVFLERSWLYYEEAGSEQAQLSKTVGEVEPAPLEIWQAIRDTIMEMPHWGGWPTDAEVERYCTKGRFL